MWEGHYNEREKCKLIRLANLCYFIRHYLIARDSTKCFQSALFGRFVLMLAYVVALFAYISTSNIPKGVT